MGLYFFMGEVFLLEWGWWRLEKGDVICGVCVGRRRYFCEIIVFLCDFVFVGYKL